MPAWRSALAMGPRLFPFQQAAVTALEGGTTMVAALPGAGKTAIWLAEVERGWPGARAVLLRDLVGGAVAACHFRPRG